MPDETELLREGILRKGGVRPKPEIPRPSKPPAGQGPSDGETGHTPESSGSAKDQAQTSD